MEINMDNYTKRHMYRSVQSLIRDYIDHDDVWDDDDHLEYNTFLNGEIQGMYRIISIIDSYSDASSFEKHCKDYAYEMRKAHTMNLKEINDD
jgi:hypothetical protein